MNSQECALKQCRSILREFLAGNIDYGEFQKQMSSVRGPLDPLDWAMEKLSPPQREEAELFSRWLGGQFGETEYLIPTKSGWEYGVSTEAYGWVDQDKYRNLLQVAFRQIPLQD